jgi:RNA polymerase sigma factor (sigma-70 family)
MSLTATPGQETAAPVRRPHHGALSRCTLRHESDERLVFLTRAGSERAFDEIMRRYQRPLQFYCLHLVGAARAEDAVQQAFMQAFVSLRNGTRREIALRPWLYRIARNCAIDLLRKQPFEHDQLDPDFDGLPQPPGVLEQKEELARIIAAIQALPEGQRRALTLRELEGRSYGEISEALGHTDSGVRQLIFRARTALRNLGALILPLHSIRWRLLGSASPGIADPHQFAAAASVSSNGGGGVIQAAASMMAAAVTLLSAPPPDHHRAHAPTQPASLQKNVQPVSALPLTGSSGASAGGSRRARREPERGLADVGGSGTEAGSALAPVTAPLAAPAAPPADPPTSLTAPNAPNASAPAPATSSPGTADTAGAPGVETMSIAPTAAAGASKPKSASPRPAAAPGSKPGHKAAPATPSAPVTPAPAKPAQPKAAAPAKPAAPRAPKKPAPPKLPSSPIKSAVPAQ